MVPVGLPHGVAAGEGLWRSGILKRVLVSSYQSVDGILKAREEMRSSRRKAKKEEQRPKEQALKEAREEAQRPLRKSQMR